MWHRLIFLLPLLLAAGPVSACHSRGHEQTKTPPKENPAVTRIHVILGDQTLEATLDDTLAARDFASLLPLELTLSDYDSTEKVADLPRALTTEGAPASYAASAGDITYYAPWGNLAIFYKSFRSASGLIRLGKFESNIAPLLQAGRFRVRIQAIGSSRPSPK